MIDMNDIRAMEALVFNLSNCLDCPMIGACLKSVVNLVRMDTRVMEGWMILLKF